jgi:hypothetical protein
MVALQHGPFPLAFEPAIALPRRQKSRLLPPETELRSEKGPQATFSNEK